MNVSLKTRWIVALLMLSVCSQALVLAPVLHDLSAVIWGLSFALLISALVLAVMRHGSERANKRRQPLQ